MDRPRIDRGVIAMALAAITACSSSSDTSMGAGGTADPAMTGTGGASGASVSGSGGTAVAGSAGGTAGAAGGTAGAAGGGTAGGAAASGSGGAMPAGAGGSAAAGSSGGMAGSGTVTPPGSAADTAAAIDAYAAAHPGQAGDVLGLTPAQVAADPAAQELLALCDDGAVPVIPQLVWEYGGGDHAWMSPDMSALVYCVYIPASPDTDHWQYDAGADAVTADVYVLYPDENPCKDEVGAAQVANCIGDPSNFEILVDTASMNDGHDAGLELSEASTDLNLILPDRSKVPLFHGD